MKLICNGIFLDWDYEKDEWKDTKTVRFSGTSEDVNDVDVELTVSTKDETYIIGETYDFEVSSEERSLSYKEWKIVE